MTNFEKIKNIEISGVKPFKCITRIIFAEYIRDNNDCAHCNCCDTDFYDDNAPCSEMVLKWLEKENTDD